MPRELTARIFAALAQEEARAPQRERDSRAIATR